MYYGERTPTGRLGKLEVDGVRHDDFCGGIGAVTGVHDDMTDEEQISCGNDSSVR